MEFCPISRGFSAGIHKKTKQPFKIQQRQLHVVSKQETSIQLYEQHHCIVWQILSKLHAQLCDIAHQARIK